MSTDRSASAASTPVDDDVTALVRNVTSEAVFAAEDVAAYDARRAARSPTECTPPADALQTPRSVDDAAATRRYDAGLADIAHALTLRVLTVAVQRKTLDPATPPPSVKHSRRASSAMDDDEYQAALLNLSQNFVNDLVAKLGVVPSRTATPASTPAQSVSAAESTAASRHPTPPPQASTQRNAGPALVVQQALRALQSGSRAMALVVAREARRTAFHAIRGAEEHRCDVLSAQLEHGAVAVQRELAARAARLRYAQTAERIVFDAAVPAAVSCRLTAARWAAWYERFVHCIVEVQRFARACSSVVWTNVLQSQCYAVLQRFGRGCLGRVRLGRFRHALAETQRCLRARTAAMARRELQIAAADRNVATFERGWLAYAHSQRVRQRCTDRALARFTVVQAACRSKFMQLLARRLMLFQAATVRDTGVNRVLKRLLHFIPDGGPASPNRRRGIVAYARGSTDDAFAVGPLRSLRMSRRRKTAYTSPVASPHRASRSPNRSRSVSPLQRSPSPQRSRSVVARTPGPGGAAAPDYSHSVSQMSRLLRESTAPRGGAGRNPKRAATPQQVVYAAARTVKALGASKRKPDWH